MRPRIGAQNMGQMIATRFYFINKHLWRKLLIYEAVIKVFKMFSQTVVKFFLRQYFLSVCILLSPKQTFPVLESNIWLSCASEECDYSSLWYSPTCHM